MKELTKREAMEILLAGGKVDYYAGDELGNSSPLSWDERYGIIDVRGNLKDIDWTKLTEHKEPKTGTVWVNIYDGGSAWGHPSRDMADELDADPGRIACIEVKWTEGEGL